MFTTHAARTALGIMPAAQRDAFGIARIGQSVDAMRGIRYAEGEGGAQPAATAPGQAGGSNPPAAPTPTPPAGAAPAAPAGNVPPAAQAVRFEDLDPKTQKEIRDLRAEAADYRTQKTAAEARAADAEAKKAAVLAALGLKPDGTDQDPDPAELTARLGQTTTEIENTKRENLVLRVGPGLGANVDRLLDSRSFATKLAGLKADDRSAVEALIRESIEQDSSLKSAPAPAASSGGTTHTGNTPTGTRKSKAAALEERYGARRVPARS